MSSQLLLIFFYISVSPSIYCHIIDKDRFLGVIE